MVTPLFEVFKELDKMWRFRLRGRNRRIIITSVDYISKRNAILAIESMQSCIEDAVIVCINKS